jgi:GTP-binding protein
MKFIDETVIEVTAGNGGNGCVSFRREKYVPRGGPDGGDGGHGGSVILHAVEGLATLLDVGYHHHYKAGRGGHGKGKQMHGAAGEDRVVLVPVGTVVYDAESGEKLVDLDAADMEWVAAQGGRGGRGNMRFVSSTSQAPRRAEKGGAGEQKKLRLELKLLADVGLIGLPNSGKSTLISAISNARPKIADYPFTTKEPVLGMVRVGVGESFVVADIPGLIEGASQGAGMGIRFLRHIERTRLLLHLVDLTDPTHRDALSAYQGIRHELGTYSQELLQRPEIIVLTKMDIPEAAAARDETAQKLASAAGRSVIAVSAPTREGLDALIGEVWKLLAVR